MNRFRPTFAFVVWMLISAPAFLVAQNAPPPPGGPAEEPKLSATDFLGDVVPFGGAGNSSELALSAQFQIEQDGRDGRLSVTAKPSSGWHIYSITQPDSGPSRTVLTVSESPAFELIGKFTADVKPEVHPPDVFAVPTEEHSVKVTWSAPIRLAEGAEPEQLKIKVVFDGQVCSNPTENNEFGTCIPYGDVSLEAAFAGYYQAAVAGPFRAENSHVTIQGHLEPGVVAPGDKVRLVLTAIPDAPWHIYAYEEKDPAKISKPTLIQFTNAPDWSFTKPRASEAPHEEETGLDDEPIVHYHEAPVHWTVEWQVPEDAAAGEVKIAGVIGYQTCKSTGCDLPTAAQFFVSFTVAEQSEPKRNPLSFLPENYSRAAQLAEESSPSEPSSGSVFNPSQIDLSDNDRSEIPIYWILPIAFVGGFILNFMPCVLPVIGLKVMSFVNQSGESRGRIFLLNAWYTLGLVSVFVVLATMAVVWNFGWGEQFNYDTFNIIMVAVIFTMGLSFLGIWEIPIPGFVGGSEANKLAQKEGPAGAVLKGAITTVLATPCSGPGLATALAWCNGKPPFLVYTIFICMGLGMASPYLVIGAFPKLIRFIPKPGLWMETFKQTMGFVLLATVVYMFTFIQWQNFVPTLALLFGLWAACWWIGRTPATAELGNKLRAWGVAATIAVLVGWLSFSMQVGFGGYQMYGLRGVMASRYASAIDYEISQRQLVGISENGVGDERTSNGNTKPDNDYELPWSRFSASKLEKLAGENKTVMVDFTASWCPTCKVLEQTVLNTEAVRQVIDDNRVVPLVADWSNKDPEVTELLSALGSKQIPVLAIFPAGNPNKPIVLIGGYTKATLIKRLREAGPSRSDDPSASTAMRE